MKRKTLLFICLIFSIKVFANTFVEGKDYVVLPLPEVKGNEGKARVVEFFSYGCPGCYAIEEQMQTWVSDNKNTIQFERSPVGYNKLWNLYAKAYYAAKLLGKEAELTPALFEAIHKNHLPVKTSDSMIDFFVAHGVDKKTAQSAFLNSPMVDLSLKDGQKRMGAYRIGAVPAVVVNGKYKTDVQMAQSPDRFFALLSFLVKG